MKKPLSDHSCAPKRTSEKCGSKRPPPALGRADTPPVTFSHNQDPLGTQRWRSTLVLQESTSASDLCTATASPQHFARSIECGRALRSSLHEWFWRQMPLENCRDQTRGFLGSNRNLRTGVPDYIGCKRIACVAG